MIAIDFKALAEARDNGNGTVAYVLADNTKTVAPISQKVFFDDKGRRRNLNIVAQIFKDTAWDLRAVAIEL